MPSTPNTASVRVVVPVDGTRESLAALRCAAQEARRRNAVLVAVTAWTPFGGELAERRQPCPEMCKDIEDQARRRLDAACRAAGPLADVTVERRVARGGLGPVLADLAVGQDDLLVIPSRRRRLPLVPPRSHPVARYCLRHTPASILLVPPQPAPRPRTARQTVTAPGYDHGARAA